MHGLHGILLMLTGVIHLLFGLLPTIYLQDWRGFLKHKLWAQVSIEDDRKMAAFWFVIAGPFLFIIGLLVFEVETRSVALPISVGWALLFTSVLGAVLSPKSGFTLLMLPQAVYYLIAAY